VYYTSVACWFTGSAFFDAQDVVVRTIQFDESDDSIQSAKLNVAGNIPEPQV